MKRYTLEEWRAEFDRRAGDEPESVAFICPSCGAISSVQTFIEVGADGRRAAQECIGRAFPEIGCDWAAFGLFQTLGKGVEIIHADGKIIEAFSFAEVAS